MQMSQVRFHRSIVLVVVCGAGIFAGCTRECARQYPRSRQETKRPSNVILITISSLRADHASCLGYKRDTTPSFDGFARRNILFKNAFATSGWMMPAHGSIFTSLYPSIHGATHIAKSLTQECYTLGEILSDNGYYCAGFCCNPRLGHENGFAQGFDLYDDYSVSVMLNSLAFGSESNIDINRTRTNDLINDAAIRWLQYNTHSPFFLFVHYYDNHWDYLPPPPYDKMYDPGYQGPVDGTKIAREPLFSNAPAPEDVEHMLALYDGEVRQSDDDLNEILAFVRDNGLFANSIVIVMGDHGEQFYEHGHTSHQGLFEELIHIPLAISIPDEQAKAKTIDSLVSQVDILPTILDYVQIPVPVRCQGTSLRPLIEDSVKSVRQFIFAEYTGGAVPDCYAVRSDRYKYYERANGAFAYDLGNDPGEQHKLLPQAFGEQVETLKISLQKLMADLGLEITR